MTKYCPSCGQELVDEAKFCKSCGKSLDGIDQNAQSNFNQGESTPRSVVPVAEKSHTVLIVIGYIGAILIPIIGVIIGIYLMTRKDSQSAQFHGKLVLVLAILVWAISFFMLMR